MARPRSDQTITYLAEHGPSLKADLPRPPTQADKNRGVFTFQIRAGRGTTESAGGHPKPVCYLPEHSREDVLSAFLDANPDLVAAKSLNGLIQVLGGHGPTWREVAKDVAPRYYDCEAEFATGQQPSAPDSGSKRCEFCNELVAKPQFPHHLATQCPKT